MTPIPQFQIHWPRLIYAVAIYAVLIVLLTVVCYAMRYWPEACGIAALGLLAAAISLIVVRAIYQMLGR